MLLKTKLLLIFFSTLSLGDAFATALILNHNDYLMMGDNAHPILARVYNSKSNFKGIFGKGWSSILDNHLELGQNVITINLHNGFRKTLTFNNRSFSENGLTVQKRADSYDVECSCLLYDLKFNDQGKLSRIKVKNDSKIYQIEHSNEFLTIRDNHFDSFKYNFRDNKVISASSSKGHEISYAYIGEKLTSVTNKSEEFYSYTYDTYFNITKYNSGNKKNIIHYKNPNTGEIQERSSLISKSDGGSSTSKKDKQGRPVEISSSRNTTAHILYDNYGRVSIVQIKDVKKNTVTAIRIRYKGNRIESYQVEKVGTVNINPYNSLSYSPVENKQQLNYALKTLLDLINSV